MQSLMVWVKTRKNQTCGTSCLSLLKLWCRFESDLIMIRRKGTIVSVGNASGTVPPFAPIRLVQKNVKLLRPTCV